MTAEMLLIGIPMAVFVFALWVGVPLWMMLRHPDRNPRETRTVPAYLRPRMRIPAAAPSAPWSTRARDERARDDAKWRELVSSLR